MQKKLPTLEQFKLLSKQYHIRENTKSLSQAKELLSQFYGYAHWRAIRPQLSDLPRSDNDIKGLNLLIVGQSGSGKTSLLLNLKDKLDTPTTLIISYKNNDFNTYSELYSEYAIYEQSQYINFESRDADFSILRQYSIIIIDEAYFTFFMDQNDTFISFIFEVLQNENITLIITAMSIQDIPLELLEDGLFRITFDLKQKYKNFLYCIGTELQPNQNVVVKSFFEEVFI